MNKLVIIVTFVVAYLVFALSSLPAGQVLSRITLPKNVQIAGVSGTLWSGNLQQLAVNNTVINNVNWTLNPVSLLTFDPVVSLRFGGGRFDGPEGHAQVSGLISQKIKIEDADIMVAANDIAMQLPLPVPMTAEGAVQLKLQQFEMGQPVCQAANGQIAWRNAQVNAFQEDISLQDLNAVLSCEQGELAVTIDPENILGLEFKAYVKTLNQVSGNGHLTPGINFPQKLKPALPFIGRADSQGRYRLKI